MEIIYNSEIEGEGAPGGSPRPGGARGEGPAENDGSAGAPEIQEAAAAPVPSASGAGADTAGPPADSQQVGGHSVAESGVRSQAPGGPLSADGVSYISPARPAGTGDVQYDAAVALFNMLFPRPLPHVTDASDRGGQQYEMTEEPQSFNVVAGDARALHPRAPRAGLAGATPPAGPARRSHTPRRAASLAPVYEAGAQVEPVFRLTGALPPAPEPLESPGSAPRPARARSARAPAGIGGHTGGMVGHLPPGPPEGPSPAVVPDTPLQVKAPPPAHMWFNSPGAVQARALKAQTIWGPSWDVARARATESRDRCVAELAATSAWEYAQRRAPSAAPAPHEAQEIAPDAGSPAPEAQPAPDAEGPAQAVLIPVKYKQHAPVAPAALMPAPTAVAGAALVVKQPPPTPPRGTSPAVQTTPPPGPVPPRAAPVAQRAAAAGKAAAATPGVGLFRDPRQPAQAQAVACPPPRGASPLRGGGAAAQRDGSVPPGRPPSRDEGASRQDAHAAPGEAQGQGDGAGAAASSSGDPQLDAGRAEWARLAAALPEKKMPGHTREFEPEKGMIPREAERWDAPTCPHGHGPMRIRSARKGGHFWGCVEYPKCTASRRPGERGSTAFPAVPGASPPGADQ